MHVVYGGNGGAGRVVVDIALNHDRRRFAPVVVLVGYEVDDRFRRELEMAGVPVYIKLKRKKWDFRFWRELRELFATEKPDVLLLHTPVAYYWGRLAVWRLKIPVVISVEHLAVTNYYGRLGRVVNFIQTRWQTDRVICVSPAVKEVIKRELLLPDGKIAVIENGIPVNRYPPRDPATLLKVPPARLLMVARLDAQKDPATLLKAVKLLGEEGYDASLSFAGDGSLRGEMEQLTRRLELNEKVFFLGRRDDVPLLFQETDIFVLSTHGEGLPIALLEAMACGLPVVATAVPGVVEVVEEGRTGLLVPEGDARAMKEAIAWLLDHPGEARAMGRQARRVVAEKYGIKRTVREYERVIEEVWQEKGKGVSS